MTKRKHGVDMRLPYRAVEDVLTTAYMRQMSGLYAKSKAQVMARELAAEILRPALNKQQRERLDAIEAAKLKGKP